MLYVENPDNSHYRSKVMIEFLTQSIMTSQIFLPGKKSTFAENCRQYMVESFSIMYHTSVFMMKCANMLRYYNVRVAIFNPLVIH